VTVDPTSIVVGDRVQAPVAEPGSSEQPIGTVVAIAGELVTFLADGEYDMYYGPGDEDYFMAYPAPKEFTVALAAVTYHWPRKPD